MMKIDLHLGSVGMTDDVSHTSLVYWSPLYIRQKLGEIAPVIERDRSRLERILNLNDTSLI